MINIKNSENFEIQFLEIVNFLAKDQYSIVNFEKNQVVVDQGKIVTNNFIKSSYAFVPLGVILEVEIFVTKHNKQTKLLVAGDYIGLFETANFLITNRPKKIGN